MRRSISSFCTLGSLGLVWLVLTSEVHAWERVPVKTNAKIDIYFEVKLGQSATAPRPTAPWYLYFPVDPNMMPSAQRTPYPPWPAPFPPSSNQPAPSKDTKRLLQNFNAPQDSRVAQVWYQQPSYGANYQPVGYQPIQAPSYWYRAP